MRPVGATAPDPLRTVVAFTGVIVAVVTALGDSTSQTAAGAVCLCTAIETQWALWGEVQAEAPAEGGRRGT
jgi:hypothetical protein